MSIERILEMISNEISVEKRIITPKIVMRNGSCTNMEAKECLFKYCRENKEVEMLLEVSYKNRMTGTMSIGLLPPQETRKLQSSENIEITSCYIGAVAPKGFVLDGCNLENAERGGMFYGEFYEHWGEMKTDQTVVVSTSKRARTSFIGDSCTQPPTLPVSGVKKQGVSKSQPTGFNFGRVREGTSRDSRDSGDSGDSQEIVPMLHIKGVPYGKEKSKKLKEEEKCKKQKEENNKKQKEKCKKRRFGRMNSSSEERSEGERGGKLRKMGTLYDTEESDSETQEMVDLEEARGKAKNPPAHSTYRGKGPRTKRGGVRTRELGNIEEKDEEMGMEDDLLDDVVGDILPKPEVLKVKTIKRVKKTRTYPDSQGYLVTEDYFSEEEVWVDKPINKSIARPRMLPAKSAKTAKPIKNQSSLHNFFGK